VFNQKGGVGKTTLAWVLSEGLSYYPRVSKILVVDNDGQCNLTDTLIKEKSSKDESRKLNILNCYKGKSVLDNILETGIDKIHLLAGGEQINDLDVKVSGMEKILDPFISGEHKGFYDYIIIDNGPASGPLQRGSLAISDLIIAPFTTDAYCFDALMKMQKSLEGFSKWNSVRIVPNMVRKTATSFAYLNSARKLWNAKVTKTEIPHGQEFHVAKELNKSIYMKRMGSGKTWLLLVDLLAELFDIEPYEITKAIAEAKTNKRKEIAKANFSTRYTRKENEK